MSRQSWIHYTDGTKDTYPIDEVYDIVGDEGISYLGGVYYAHEMFNTIMVQYDYHHECFDAALQYSTKRDVGKLKNDPTYKVNYDVYGAKIGTNIVEDWNLTTAYTGVSDDYMHAYGAQAFYTYNKDITFKATLFVEAIVVW